MCLYVCVCARVHTYSCTLGGVGSEGYGQAWVGIQRWVTVELKLVKENKNVIFLSLSVDQIRLYHRWPLKTVYKE